MDQEQEKSLPQDEKIKLLTKADNDNRVKSMLLMSGVLVGAAALYFLSSYISNINTASDATEHTETAQTLPESIDTETARNEFKAALAEFEQSLQPYLDAPALKAWAKVPVAQLLADKEEVLVYFAQGKYVQAQHALTQLESKVSKLVADWQAAFTDTLASAQTAFDEERINLASINLQKAAEIQPEAESVKALQSRINAYSDVKEFINQYKVGLVENDLEKQVLALSQALALDPLRTDLSPLLDAAQSALQEQTLKSKLQAAQNALMLEDYAAAERAYSEAAQISPNDQAVLGLREELDTIALQQTLDEALEVANVLAQEDDWQQVRDYTNQALAIFPENASLNQLNASATDILSTLKTLKSYSNRPQRLTDSNIRDAAKTVLKKSVPLMTRSATVAQEVKRLGALIRDMESTVALTVISDNRTHIIVKGKGIIGKTKKKTVSLTPGNYILEASRDGYRSKMLEVNLSPGQSDETIHLVCNEKI